MTLSVIPGMTDTLLSLLRAGQSNGRPSLQGIAGASTDFSSSLTLRMAELQEHSLTTLLGATFGGDQTASRLDFLTDAASLWNVRNVAPNSAASGRNLSLFDPESAYAMMSVINDRDVTYKAQYAELSELSAAVGDLQQAGKALATIDAASGGAAITAHLQAFVGKYNEWIERFDGSVKRGGLLAGTQAAEVSLYELEQSIGNVFNGAADGFHGLHDLGVVVDSVTGIASLDVSRLDVALAGNPRGVVNTIDEFAANFARSAELLVSSNNFLPNRLANLDRTIDFIRENKAALQAEFGLGDPARPSPEVAAALAAYESMTAA